MTRAREKELRKCGLSTTKAAVLFTVKVIGRDATLAETSRRLLREKHSVSLLLSRMERQGLIKRVKDLPNRNITRIILTRKGEEAYVLSTRSETMPEIVSVLSERERESLWYCLERMRNRALKLAGISYELPFPAGWSQKPRVPGHPLAPA